MSATLLRSASPSESSSAVPSRLVSKSVIAGRVITGIALAFMTFDVGVKLVGAKEAIEGTAHAQHPWVPPC